jgi:DNA-binding NarL/FixJ family response regulator
MLADTFTISEVSHRGALDQVMLRLSPDLLVLDLTLPQLGGLAGLSHIRGLSPSTKTLVLTEAPSETEGIAVLKAGAKGYYARYIDLSHLKKAVHVIQKGEIWIQRTLVTSLIGELTTHAGPGQSEPDAAQAGLIEGLSIRQRLVADLVSKGASNKEIASMLNICERTVKAHLTEVFRAIGVPDRLQLALLLNRRIAPSQLFAVDDGSRRKPDAAMAHSATRPSGGTKGAHLP